MAKMAQIGQNFQKPSFHSPSAPTRAGPPQLEEKNSKKQKSYGPILSRQ